MTKPIRFSYDWWRGRVMEAVIAILLAYLVVQISGMVSLRQKNLLPATAWFVVNEVYVPDHDQGEEPDILYDRVIYEAFTGLWIVEVQRVQRDGFFRNVCSGSGQSLYEPDETLAENVVPLFWFIGRDCKIEPGNYRLRISYTLQRPGWPVKSLFATSNSFIVRDPEADAERPDQ